MIEFIKRQISWSLKTFGPGKRTKGITEHIRKELKEIEAAPDDLMEWMDVIILGIDGAHRCARGIYGQSMSDEDLAERVEIAIKLKQFINFSRTYPMPTSQDEPSEHVRERCPNCRSIENPCLCQKNICRICGKPVGNITFTVCDECWDKEK